jgi:hypothetical protein
MKYRRILGTLAAGAVVLAAWSAQGGGTATAIDLSNQPPPGSGTVTYRAPADRASSHAPRVETDPTATDVVSDQSGIFHPLTPCRLVDTRLTAGGIIPAATARNFFAVSTSGLADQGGSATDCGIPFTATSIHINVTSAQQTGVGAGNVRAYPSSATLPQAAFLTFTAGTPVSNAGTIGICRTAAGQLCPLDDFTIWVSRPSHIIVDVLGYYEPPLTAQINANGTVFGTSLALDSASNLGIGNYEVIFDRDVSKCVFQAQLGNGDGASGGVGFTWVADRLMTPTGVLVATTNSAGALADQAFQLNVIC